jgi:transposase, IS5 family
MEQRSLFGLSEHLERTSKGGDPLEVLEATVDFECRSISLRPSSTLA